MEQAAGHMDTSATKHDSLLDQSHHGHDHCSCPAGERPTVAAVVDRATGHTWRGSRQAGCWAALVPAAGEAERNCKPWL